MYYIICNFTHYVYICVTRRTLYIPPRTMGGRVTRASTTRVSPVQQMRKRTVRSAAAAATTRAFIAFSLAANVRRWVAQLISVFTGIALGTMAAA